MPPRGPKARGLSGINYRDHDDSTLCSCAIRRADEAARTGGEILRGRCRFGSGEARAFFDDLTAMVGVGETVIEDLIDAGDRVVLCNRTRIHGGRSGIEDEVVFSQVVTFRGGKIVMLEYFLDHDAALEAAGLAQ